MIERARHSGRRIRQTITSFGNGPQILGAMVGRRVLGRPEELTFSLPGGGTVTCPNRPGARVPVYEVFAEDAYRLRWFTDDLGPDRRSPSTSAATSAASRSPSRGKHPGAPVARLRSLARRPRLPASATSCRQRSRAPGCTATPTRSRRDRRHPGVRRQRRGQCAQRADLRPRSRHGQVRSDHVSPTPSPAAGGSVDVVKIDTEGARVRHGPGLRPGRLGRRTPCGAGVPRRPGPLLGASSRRSSPRPACTGRSPARAPRHRLLSGTCLAAAGPRALDVTRLPSALQPAWPLFKRVPPAGLLPVGAVVAAYDVAAGGARPCRAGPPASSSETAALEPRPVTDPPASSRASSCDRPIPPVGYPSGHWVLRASVGSTSRRASRLDIERRHRSSATTRATITPGGTLDYETSDYFGVTSWREHPVFLRRRLPRSEHVDGTLRRRWPPAAGRELLPLPARRPASLGCLRGDHAGPRPRRDLRAHRDRVPARAAGARGPRRRAESNPEAHRASAPTGCSSRALPNPELVAPRWTIELAADAAAGPRRRRPARSGSTSPAATRPNTRRSSTRTTLMRRARGARLRPHRPGQLSVQEQIDHFAAAEVDRRPARRRPDQPRVLHGRACASSSCSRRDTSTPATGRSRTASRTSATATWSAARTGGGRCADERRTHRHHRRPRPVRRGRRGPAGLTLSTFAGYGLRLRRSLRSHRRSSRGSTRCLHEQVGVARGTTRWSAAVPSPRAPRAPSPAPCRQRDVGAADAGVVLRTVG